MKQPKCHKEILKVKIMEIDVEVVGLIILSLCFLGLIIAVAIGTTQYGTRWTMCKSVMEAKFPNDYIKVTSNDNDGLCCADIGKTKNDSMLSIENKCIMVRY